MKKLTMKQKVINFIKAAGTKGRSFSKIQRYIVEKLHNLNYDEMSPRHYYNYKTHNVYFKPARKYRGYWCINLYGPSYYSKDRRNGILNTYCNKVNRRWVAKEFC